MPPRPSQQQPLLLFSPPTLRNTLLKQSTILTFLCSDTTASAFTLRTLILLAPLIAPLIFYPIAPHLNQYPPTSILTSPSSSASSSRSRSRRAFLIYVLVHLTTVITIILSSAPLVFLLIFDIPPKPHSWHARDAAGAYPGSRVSERCGGVVADVIAYERPLWVTWEIGLWCGLLNGMRLGLNRLMEKQSVRGSRGHRSGKSIAKNGKRVKDAICEKCSSDDASGGDLENVSWVARTGEMKRQIMERPLRCEDLVWSIIWGSEAGVIIGILVLEIARAGEW